MSLTKRAFRVVTHKNWIADAFADVGAVQDFGFDIDPTTARDTVWWAPGAWVASAAKAGVGLPLLSCGPRWLDSVPPRYRGRTVTTCRLDEIEDRPGARPRPLFVKLPEAKVDSCPARVYETNLLASTLAQHRFTPNTLIQIQDVVDFKVEARFWVAHGEITASSFYRVGDQIWGSDDFSSAVASLGGTGWTTAIWRRARDVVRDPELHAPPGYVLDVGLTPGGAYVVEANAAWSSGPYDADPAGVYAAIVAAHDFDGQHPQWAWQPHQAFDKAGPLKLSTPV